MRYSEREQDRYDRKKANERWQERERAIEREIERERGISNGIIFFD